MRKLLCTLVSMALSLGLTSAASAATLNWDGTMKLSLGTLPTMVATGAGVATVNASGGLGHLNTLRLAGGITNALTIIPLTDPANPSLATLRGTSVALGTGTVKPISGGGPLTANTFPLSGNFKLCLLFAGCNAWLDIPMQTGTKGVGIGGQIVINGFGAGARISIANAPWTIATAMIMGVYTTNAMIAGGARATENSTFTGFAHGPASASSTANIGGALLLVSPTSVNTNLMVPSNFLGLPLEIRLQFVPEPGLILLLASGVAGLTLLGRHRMRP